jgi:hypothetical protein
MIVHFIYIGGIVDYPCLNFILITLCYIFCTIPPLQLTVVSLNLYYETPTKRVGLVQSGPHQHLIEN